MKLVTGQFNDSYKPVMDGVGNVVDNYAFWLNRKYGTSVVVCPEVPGYHDHEDFEVLRFQSIPTPTGSPYRIGLPGVDFSFRKELGRFDFNLVHAHCPFVSGDLAMKLARRRGIPLVTTFHSKYRDDFESMLSSPTLADLLTKRMMRFYYEADYIWVPSESTGRTLREYGYEGDYLVQENGTDVAIPSQEEYRRLRSKGQSSVGASSEEAVLLFVGQHRWVKNIRLIVRGAAELARRGRQFRLVFVGEGHERTEIERFVHEQGIADRTVFKGLIVERERIKEIYARADLFVFPSLYDTVGIVVREAAAFGVPAVLVEGTNAAEQIRDGENGFLIQNDAESLAAKVAEVLDHRDALRRAGEGARKSIYRHWEGILDRVHDQYEHIIREYAAA
jgi:glycosyltransferase involved in cell wall biosynthesis